MASGKKLNYRRIILFLVGLPAAFIIEPVLFGLLLALGCIIGPIYLWWWLSLEKYKCPSCGLKNNYTVVKEVITDKGRKHVVTYDGKYREVEYEEGYKTCVCDRRHYRYPVHFVWRSDRSFLGHR